MYLLDVNVLLALAWPSHEHHARCHAWFNVRQGSTWATCPITQCGFVRLSCNAKVVATPTRPALAVQVLQRITALPAHQFWPDDVPPVSALDVGLRGHRQVTDAYLVALARHHGGQLATLDAGVATLPSPLGARSVEIIP